MRECKILTLSNGIRVVHKRIESASIVHCGIFLEIGSRDEQLTNQGIAHFWEHMAFKGTKRRKSFHIINTLDSIGGELNAFTEKEKVVFYSSVRKEYFEKAMDIVTDIAFHSTFPIHEIEKERGVILEEMTMYQDDPDDSLQDEFDNVIFRDHSMGMNILGREETVKSFKRKDFTSFVSENLNTHKVVFVCVGDVSLDELERLTKKYLERIPQKKSLLERGKFTGYKPREVILKRTLSQARCGIGREAYSIKHKNRIPFFMLVNYLGGPGLNSRLNYLLREKRGMVYSADANFTPYSDTGMFSIYFGTEPRQLAKCIALIETELERLATDLIGVRQFSALREQIKGHMALSEENNLGLALMMGRSVLDFGRVPTLLEVYDRVDRVDVTKVRDTAQQIFNKKKMSYLIMEPDGSVTHK